MKKILVIHENIDKRITGGLIIDGAFVDQLKNNKYLSVDVMQNIDVKSDSIIKYNLFFFRRLFSLFKYDYIFTNSRLYSRLLPVLILVKILSKTKLLMYHHHYDYLTRSGFKKIIIKYLELFFLRISDTVLIPSPYALELTQKLLPYTKIEYIEIGFENKREFRIKEYTPTLLFVGTIEERKGIHYLIKVAEILYNRGINLKINIIGSLHNYCYVENIKAQIRDKGLENICILRGRVSQEELIELYKRSSLFVFPSLHEGYGMAIVEAMSYGLPVICFDNSAMPYTVKNGYNGIMAANKDSHSFAESILRIHNDSELYKRLSLGAWEYANKKPSWDTMLLQMRNYICTL